MDLQEPQKKMSTTGGTQQGTVGLLDPPEVVRKKFKSAVTDSGSEVRHSRDEKPGISNLIEIMSVATGEAILEIEARYDGQGWAVQAGGRRGRSSPCSARSSSATRSFAPTRPSLRSLLALGAEKARQASGTHARTDVRAMGFVRP
jgi:tryptophanyl-tRNA synthetase